MGVCALQFWISVLTVLALDSVLAVFQFSDALVGVVLGKCPALFL